MEKIFTKILTSGLWGAPYMSGSGSTFEATISYRKRLKDIITLGGIKSVVDIGCGNWDFYHEEFDGVDYIGYDCVQELIDLNITKFRCTDKRRFVYQDALDDAFDPPKADLFILKDVLQHLSNANILSLLTKIRRRARFILVSNDYSMEYQNIDIPNGGYRRLNPLAEPFLTFPFRPIDVCGGKFMMIIPGNNTSIIELKYSEHHDTPFKEKVLIAILARNKAGCLPKYLECIRSLNYDPKLITLYINTNNNIDSTKSILEEWLLINGSRYAKVIFESVDVADGGPNIRQWSPERCGLLATIRNRSMQVALEENVDYYFVADCDNFVVNPYTLKELIAQRKPIIGPMLYCFPHNPYYSNFWCGQDANGYYVGDPYYNNILFYRHKSNHPVPVIHCTYLVKAEFIPLLSYIITPETFQNYYEFAIFSKSARDHAIDQYVCNHSFYGYLYLSLPDSTVEEEAVEISKWISTSNGVV